MFFDICFHICVRYKSSYNRETSYQFLGNCFSVDMWIKLCSIYVFIQKMNSNFSTTKLRNISDFQSFCRKFFNILQLSSIEYPKIRRFDHKQLFSVLHITELTHWPKSSQFLFVPFERNQKIAQSQCFFVENICSNTTRDATRLNKLNPVGDLLAIQCL